MTTETTIREARTPAADDDDAIRTTIDDYYLGWFDADGDRMARALHPELIKRGWLRDKAGEWFVEPDTRTTMVEASAAGRGRATDPAARRYTTTVHIHGDIAAAVVHAVPYVDYVHLVRTPDGWRIINVLWCPA